MMNTHFNFKGWSDLYIGLVYVAMSEIEDPPMEYALEIQELKEAAAAAIPQPTMNSLLSKVMVVASKSVLPMPQKESNQIMPDCLAVKLLVPNQREYDRDQAEAGQ